MERVTQSKRDQQLADTIMALSAPDFTSHFSGWVKQLAAFDNLIIIAYQGERRPDVLYRECVDPVVYQQMDSHYLEGAYLLDPFYREHLKGGVRGIRRLADVAPDRFWRTHYYEHYYRQTTLLDEIAIFAQLNDDVTLNACFGKDRSSNQPFSPSELTALGRHEHTLAGLLSRHWQHYRPESAQQAPPLPLEKRLREALYQQRGIQLSPRQAEVALFILRGHSSLSISLHLNVSLQTVKVFRRQLYARCRISSQAELFALLVPFFAQLTSSISTP
ncbi:helix-turn-helix transcriptional regulator [Halomonas sp. GD1P12]|uniref:helix-turn-helix transcriptional regulator n=1 Tax=Halomonas sp. GD1P12 TaxID=2982691 RepID=UPI0021E4C7C7|nr:helix-turn-helix transcriptional regulator [Halomonas sp. GD1P12]UYG00279.1 helix-turn-helix transcriptional regulator [Halomonas sp. GD1P12]